MSQSSTAEETKRKLEELGAKITAAKASLGAKGEIAADVQKDWQDMVQTHADIGRKLDAQSDHSSHFLEGLRFDIDILRHAFEKWMARNEGNFSQDK